MADFPEIEYTIENELPVHQWIEGIGWLRKAWYNPIVQARYIRSPYRERMIRMARAKWINILMIALVLFTAVTSILFAQGNWNRAFGSEVKFTMDSSDLQSLIMLPIQLSWLYGLMLAVVAIFEVPKRLRFLSNRNQPDQIFTTPLSDSYIYLSECFSPVMPLINLFIVAWGIIFFNAFAFIVVDSPAFGERLAGVSFAMDFFGNAFGFAALLVLMGLMWFLLGLLGVLLTGFFSLRLPVIATWFSSIVCLVAAATLLRNLVIILLQSVYPGYIDPYGIFSLSNMFPFPHNDLTMESGVPFILSFLILDIILTGICGIIYWLGVKTFGSIRRGR